MRRFRSPYAPASMAVGCFVSSGRSLDAAVQRVRLAEELGYEACYVTHIAGRESLTLLTIYASATDRLRIGTGVVPIYTRTPATMAQTAATINESRTGACGSGSGSRTGPWSRAGTGSRSTRPPGRCASTSRSCGRSCAARTRLRAASGRPASALAGVDIAPDLPIYIAALSNT